MHNNEKQTNGGEAKAKPEVIKLGLDLHARQVTECRQLDGSTPKPAQRWDPWQLLDQIERWVKAGISVYSCYEAGACGYWYHRELVKRGAVNFVVAPEPLENERRRRQKTDRLDARSLLHRLAKYLGGNRDAMSVVAVPSIELERQRSIERHREQLVRNRRRAEARGRVLALSQSILCAGYPHRKRPGRECAVAIHFYDLPAKTSLKMGKSTIYLQSNEENSCRVLSVQLFRARTTPP
jgi:transposase